MVGHNSCLMNFNTQITKNNLCYLPFHNKLAVIEAQQSENLIF